MEPQVLLTKTTNSDKPVRANSTCSNDNETSLEDTFRFKGCNCFSPELFCCNLMKTLIVLIGPTGVGKTELSLRLAEHFGTCIISADSRQLYADLKIGTAAPTPEQLQRVRHYFVGTLQLTDYYSAAQYEAEVLQLLEQLYTRHEVVLLTGGSMMYVDAVCKGIDDIPTVDAETRRLMLHKYETEGLEHLCAELKLLDPEYYKIVDLKNHKRVIHALEICYMTGKTYTSFRTQQKKNGPSASSK